MLAHDVPRILDGVCAYYKIDPETLFISKRGEINEPRNVAVYLCRKLRQDRLTDICNYFRMNKYSSVSSIIRRVKNRMAEDKKFKGKIEKISDIINKGQDQI